MCSEECQNWTGFNGLNNIHPPLTLEQSEFSLRDRQLHDLKSIVNDNIHEMSLVRSSFNIKFNPFCVSFFFFFLL